MLGARPALVSVDGVREPMEVTAGSTAADPIAAITLNAVRIAIVRPTYRKECKALLIVFFAPQRAV
jgi:hypothetical protein